MTSSVEVTEMKMFRWACIHTLREHVINNNIRERLEADNITEKSRKARQRWFGHVNRRYQNYVGRNTLQTLFHTSSINLLCTFELHVVRFVMHFKRIGNAFSLPFVIAYRFLKHQLFTSACTYIICAVSVLLPFVPIKSHQRGYGTRIRATIKRQHVHACCYVASSRTFSHQIKMAR